MQREGTDYVESEFWFNPEANTVTVNVTDIYDAELRKLLAEVGEEFSWSGVEFSTVAEGNDVSQWATLHQATKLTEDGCRGEGRGTGR